MTDFDTRGFPEAFTTICAGSDFELGDYVWLTDSLLFFPDAIATTYFEPSFTFSVPLLFNMDHIAASFTLPCERIDLTTTESCLQMLVTNIGLRSGTQPSIIGHSRHSDAPAPRVFAYIDEIPWGVSISALSKDESLPNPFQTGEFEWTTEPPES